MQHTPLRPSGTTTAGLNDLHSGLTPDLCSLVLRDFNQDAAYRSPQVMTPSHYGVVAKRLEDLYGSSRQESDYEGSAPILDGNHQQDQFFNKEQHLGSNLDPLQLARDRRARSLGRYGLASEALTVRPSSEARPQNYSVSLIAAVTQEAIVGA